MNEHTEVKQTYINRHYSYKKKNNLKPAIKSIMIFHTQCICREFIILRVADN